MVGFLMCLIGLLFSVTGYAVKVTVHDPCDTTPILDVQSNFALPRSLGDATIAVLEDAGIAYRGNHQGINQIENSPVGSQALEVLSDSELRAYGWCFKKDGEIIDLLPNDVQIKNQATTIEWFFAYAHYLGGQWVSYCVPTSLDTTPFVCSSKEEDTRN